MYEYKVVPAPQRAAKAKGLKTTAERFAHALAERINAEAAGGWQFLRSESLPCEERTRLGGSKLSQQVVMIFARELGQARPDAAAALAAVQQSEPALRNEPRARSDDDEPAISTAPAPQRRQEPLFRSGAMLRADAAGQRAEPVLRPRSTQSASDADEG